MKTAHRSGLTLMFMAVICGIIGDTSVLTPIKTLVILFFVVGMFMFMILETDD